MLLTSTNWIERSLNAVLGSVIAVCLLSGTNVQAEDSPEFEIGETIYENPMSSPEDVKDWVVESSKEGNPVITSSPENEDMLRLQSQVHFLFWCPEEFPDNIAVSWDFLPIERVDDLGLAMFWIAATGKGGKDLFDPSLDERQGHYMQYRAGDINALHVSYFRRNLYNQEARFHLVSLRKSTVQDRGPTVAQGADPMADGRYAEKPYRIRVIKHGPYFQMSIKDRHGQYNGFLKVLEWKDNGQNAPILKGGKIGFRQMRGLIADYANLKVKKVNIAE